MDFKNKVVLVTGASSGIGASTAILFAKEGADVAIVGRNQKKLDDVASKIAKVGEKPLVINADVSKDDDAKRIITGTVAKFGKLDILINNAGLGKNGSILNGNVLEAYDLIMSVNLRAVINLTALATPHLAATKGNIINVSAVGSLFTSPNPDMISYCMSKAALDHFTRGAALELAPSGIRVNSVNPRPTITDFIDNSSMSADWNTFSQLTALNRVSQPEEIGDLILYLTSEKATGVTGSIFVHDNGFLLKN